MRSPKTLEKKEIMPENHRAMNGKESIVARLLDSADPSIVFRTRVEILGESPISMRIKEIQRQVSHSYRVRSLLSERGRRGTSPWHHYSKWCGAHWILSSLAD